MGQLATPQSYAVANNGRIIASLWGYFCVKSRNIR